MLIYDSQLVQSALANEKHYLFISKASGTDWIYLALCTWCVTCEAVEAIWDGKYPAEAAKPPERDWAVVDDSNSHSLTATP